jgi:hypothetical protein
MSLSFEPRTYKEANMRRLILALALYALLSVFDWASTVWAIQSGLGTEANPLMARVFEYGWGASLAVKLIVTGVVALSCCFLYNLHKINPALGGRGAAWFAIGVNLVGQSIVLVWNFAQLARIM